MVLDYILTVWDAEEPKIYNAKVWNYHTAWRWGLTGAVFPVEILSEGHNDPL